eukprot:TRINITY_DN5550_c0_g1_i1.p1 TRINITY_DN5550_c0_g1~~TRINITY_DN5550_c0_g1_i1.p1  ORF type:complete len:310 (+),score=62.03 TRINITY_DN5550_c0_g1_i1:30-959(+)
MAGLAPDMSKNRIILQQLLEQLLAQCDVVASEVLHDQKLDPAEQTFINLQTQNVKQLLTSSANGFQAVIQCYDRTVKSPIMEQPKQQPSSSSPTLAVASGFRNVNGSVGERITKISSKTTNSGKQQQEVSKENVPRSQSFKLKHENTAQIPTMECDIFSPESLELGHLFWAFFYAHTHSNKRLNFKLGRFATDENQLELKRGNRTLFIVHRASPRRSWSESSMKRLEQTGISGASMGYNRVVFVGMCRCDKSNTIVSQRMFNEKIPLDLKTNLCGQIGFVFTYNEAEGVIGTAENDSLVQTIRNLLFSK